MNIILNDFKKINAIQAKKINYYIDYYWSISLTKAYNFTLPDQTFTIGSLLNDWYWLQLILQKKNITTLVDFDRLGNMITFFEHELFQPSEKKIGPFFTINIEDLLNLYIHFLSKAEDAGFISIQVSIDLYKTIPPKDAVIVSSLEETITSMTQSFAED